MRIVNKKLIKKELTAFEPIKAVTNLPFEIRGTSEIPEPPSEVVPFIDFVTEIPSDPEPEIGPQGPPGRGKYFYGPDEPDQEDIGEELEFELGDKWFNTATNTEFTYLPTDETFEEFFWRETSGFGGGLSGFPEGPSGTEIDNSINYNTLGLVTGISRKFPVLLDDGSLTFDYIRSSDILSTFRISSFTTDISQFNLVGIGNFSLDQKSFSAQYTPPSSSISSAVVTTTAPGASGFPLSMNEPGFTGVETALGSKINYPPNSTTNNTRTFTLSATTVDNSEANSSLTINFRNNIYRGVSSNSSLMGGQLSQLSAVLPTQSNPPFGSFSVNSQQGQYIYYAYSNNYPPARFLVGGFEGGFDLLGTSSHTNSNGFTETYKIYRSVNTNLGSVTVVVQQG
jgi:hypothetical protein